MFKKLLVVVLALTFLVSLCSVALATKDPNEFKRGTNLVGTPGAGRLLYTPQPIHPPTPFYTGSAPQYIPDPQPLMRSGAATCGVNLQYGSINFYFNGSAGFGQAVRWDAGTDVCTLKTVSLVIYLATSTFGASAGLTGYVWADDGSGLPGAVISSTNMPHASIVGYPNTDDFMPNVVINGGEYHTGYIPNSATDTYAGLMDNGSGGANASTSLYIQGDQWYGNGGVFQSGDINWVQETETCCYTPGGSGSVCSTQLWHCAPTYRWPGFTPAQRFTSDGACTLKTFRFFISSFGAAGYTGGVNVRVYSDAAGLPGSILGSVFVPHASLTLGGYTSVDLSPLNLVMSVNQDYHIGYVRVNPAEDYQPVGDNGDVPASCPEAGVLRGSASLDGGLTWDFMATLDPGYDDNWVMQVDVCCATVTNACDNQNYAGSPFYYWPEPDAYGDQFRNQRFTNVEYCSLKTVNLGFDASGSIGAPGAQVNIWNSDGTYPTSVITSYVINPVVDFFPVFTSIDVTPANLILAGDYHVGYTTILNNPTDVLAILSDDGNSGSGRSGEFYLGQWWLMANSWGVDVDFLINVDRCCLPPGYCPVTCSATDQWPTFSHDYARTGQSQLTLGDLCGIVSAWSFVGNTASNFSSPVISNDLVLCAHDDRIQAVNLLTGILAWDTKVLAGYATAINTGLRSQITIDGGAFYIGTGGLRGFLKGDLATGALIWARGIGVGSPLPGVPGLVTYGGNIVRGNEVYFGDANGQIYALNATTGADLYSAQLLTSTALKGAIIGAPSTDGNQLFVPIAANLANTTTGIGGVHSVTPGASFTPNWYFESPFVPTLHEGFASAPAVRCDNLFIQASFGYGLSGDNTGYRQNLDPATGIPKWASYFLSGANLFGGNTSVSGNTAYYSSLTNGFNTANGAVRGVRAVSFANSTVWVNGGTPSLANNNVFQSTAVTCDPYVVYGAYSLNDGIGHWIIADGNTGAKLIDYSFDAGIPNGTAIATGSDGVDYLVVSTRWEYFTTNGGLFAFKNGGPRPRLSIPETLVMFPGTNTAEASPVQRTDIDAVLNVGCATLNVTATLEAGNPPAARISTVNPALAKKADFLANTLVDYTVEEMMYRQPATANLKGAALNVEMDAAGEVLAVTRNADIKVSKANSAALAQPTWVDWVSPFSAGATVNFGVAAGLGQSFTFEFDRSGMNFLAPNNFFVEIDSDDPDYNLQFPLASPQAVIEYQIPYEYCAVDTGRMEFGTSGGEWYSNRGELGDGAVSFDFTLDGSDDPMYEGSMFFMTSMNDAAWNPFGSTVPHDFGFLYPFYVGPFVNGDCGGCDYNVSLPVEYTTNNGVSYANTIGDLCTFAMIDSLQGAGLWPNQAGPEIGLLIEFREVGTYGADFGDFKLIVVDVNNRNANPVNGLYYGVFEDWDPSGGDEGAADMDEGFAYIYGTNPYGHIGLPRSGSYWPDGTKTDPAYNVAILDNPTQVYPPANYPLDSLFAFVDSRPEGNVEYVLPGSSDRSYVFAMGKTDLPAFGSHSYGFAVFGLTGSANFSADASALSKFVNKYAGFARGDVNNDDLIDLRDLVRLSRYVSIPGSPGPAPFKHLGDVDNDGDVDADDCAYLAAYYFTGGAPPKSAFMF